MQSVPRFRPEIPMRRPLLALSLLAVAGPALARNYEFLAAPQTDLNRVYRVDRLTGEMTACQYGPKEGTFGRTVCFGPGEGARAQDPSDFGLIASRHEREAGVFRVDYRTGAISICYVFEDKVVCTPSEKGMIPR
jgi:hypothetical protein